MVNPEEKYREQIEEQVDTGTLLNIAVIFVFTFLMFFIVAAVFFLLAKFLLKGDGNYSAAMSAYGPAYYILILQVIVMLIYALATDSLITGTSVAYFLKLNSKEFGGYLLSKADPFSIWFYSIAGIGLAKMFNSDKTGKYLLTIISTWICFSILFFFAAKQFPLFQMLIQ